MNAIRTTKKSDPAPAETASRAAVDAGAGVSLDISTIPAQLYDHALNAWSQRDINMIVALIGHEERFDFLINNITALIQLGLYEQVLCDAFTHGPQLHPDMWRFAFSFADRLRLASCGEPMPTEPIKVYRGVRDCRKRKYIRGLSWTTDPHIAAWFSVRFGESDYSAVYETDVSPDRIYFTTDDRNEREVITDVQGLKIKRLRKMPEPIKGGV